MDTDNGRVHDTYTYVGRTYVLLFVRGTTLIYGCMECEECAAGKQPESEVICPVLQDLLFLVVVLVRDIRKFLGWFENLRTDTN